MSWLLSILWVAGAVVIFLVARADFVHTNARYRTAAAIAAGALWPVWTILIAVFLLADLIEWLVRRAAGGPDREV